MYVIHQLCFCDRRPTGLIHFMLGLFTAILEHQSTLALGLILFSSISKPELNLRLSGQQQLLIFCTSNCELIERDCVSCDQVVRHNWL